MYKLNLFCSLPEISLRDNCYTPSFSPSSSSFYLLFPFQEGLGCERLKTRQNKAGRSLDSWSLWSHLACCYIQSICHEKPKLTLPVMLNLLVSGSHSPTTLPSSNDKNTPKVTLLAYLPIILAGNKLLRAVTRSTDSPAWKQPKIFILGKETLAK